MNVFISYNRKEAWYANQLKDSILDYNLRKYNVWYDKNTIGGHPWWDQICDEIENSNVFIAVTSRAYWKSPACKVEFKYAQDLGKPIIPLVVENNIHDLSVSNIRTIQYIYDPFSMKGGVKLLNAIEATRDKQRPHNSNISRPKVPDTQGIDWMKNIVMSLIPILGLVLFILSNKRSAKDKVFISLHVIVSLIALSYLFSRSTEIM